MHIVNVKNQVVHSHSAYEGYLGITEASFCPNSKVIAVAQHDDYIRLLVSPDWKLLSELLHETSIKTGTISVFRESSNRFELIDLPVEFGQSDGSAVSQLKWAVDCKFLASVSEKVPTVVFIWQIENVSAVAVVVTSLPVKQIEWSPVEEVLAISTGGEFVCFWSPNGVVYEGTMGRMEVEMFAWRPDGEAIVAVDCQRGRFEVGYREGEADLL
jgi:WD40 repeat protein